METESYYSHRVSRIANIGLTLAGLLAAQWTAAQDFSTATAINNAGDVVGGSTGKGIIFDAFKLDRTGFQPLGTFGGPASFAFAVNDQGAVVGQSDTANLDANAADYISVAFIAGPDGVRSLGTLPGYNHSQAFAINNSGQVVGWSYNLDPVIPGRTVPNFHAFLYENGVIQDLGTLGGATSTARGINDEGWVVGSSRNAGGQTLAFLYRDGLMTSLGTLGSGFSEALAINARGQIVGRSRLANGQLRAFLFEGGAMSDLGTLGGTFSAAFAINDRGDIVGQAETITGERHACLFSNSSLHDLGTLGGSSSIAFGINNRRDIVGQSLTASGETHAFLFKEGTMYDLGTLP